MDKLNHFFAGFLIALVASILCAAFGMPDGYLKGFIVAAVAGLAGIAKEVWDYYSDSGVPDVYDFAATLTGGVIVAAIIIIL